MSTDTPLSKKPKSPSDILWLKRAEHTAWRRLGEETVVVDLEAHFMFGLDSAAAELWQALESALPRHRMPLAMAECVDQMYEAGLLVAVEAVEEGSLPVLEGPPKILWREAMAQAAATCAFLPGQSALCNQVPFS